MPKIPDDPAYLARLQDYYARWRSLPAYGPLQAVLGLASRSAVAKVLHRLREAGFVERTPDGRWTPTGRFFARPLADAPAPAGWPAALPDSGGEFSIDAWLIRQPSRTVLMPVTGDSMMEAGIHSGDRVVVERDAPARPGDVVVALIEGEFTVKTLALDHGEVVLQPANPAYPVLRPGARLQVFGVVVGLIRNYRRSC